MKDEPSRDAAEDRDALWDLLGQSRPPQVKPFFVRRVMRETARLKEEGNAATRWLRRLTAGAWLPHPVWSGAFAAALVAAVSLTLAFHPALHRARRLPARVDLAQNDLRDEISPQDVEVIANLDNLMAYEENRIWTDDSNAD